MSVYKTYSDIELTELSSYYLVDSWSYSKVIQFARNQKAFEMLYVYGMRQKSSAATVAGSAYHYALQVYFEQKAEGREISLAELEIFAFNYIDEIEPADWKLQKNTPSVEDCKKKANKMAVTLLGFFYQEKNKYEDFIHKIIDVEVYASEYLTINGVDIPIKCNMKIDLVIETHDGKIVIIDHKSKSAYTPDDEISLSVGKQAITYIKGYESKTGLQVDEVWFAENKHSKNKDGSGQIKIFKIILDEDTKKLYEHLLYEPLKKMLEAISDPDFVYAINDSDNFVDRAEIYDFWAKTMMAEIEDVPMMQDKRELIQKRTKKIKDSSIQTINPKVIRDFRKNASQFIQYDLSMTDMTDQEKIEHILRKFNIIVNVAHTFDGYSSNTYLLEVSAGTRINSIQSYKLDIASALNVNNVRIPANLCVYDGKSYVCIETSKKRARDLMWDAKEIEANKIPLGKDNLENTIYWNLDNQSTPHLLVGGATGSGKSVFVDSIIESAKQTDVQHIYLLDPKIEFTKHRSQNISLYHDVDEIEEVMNELVEKMNEKIRQGKNDKTLIVIDEIADIIDALGTKSSFHTSLKRILQKGRSSGFRVVVATQRASVKVISGDIKVNFPVQVCFRMQKEIDSKVMIDEAGAETLAGHGDGLLKSPEYLDTVRFQSFYHK